MKLRLGSLLSLIIILSFCTQPKDENPSNVEDLAAPTASNSSLPYLVKGEDGRLYLSWVEKKDSNRVVFKFSSLEADSWETPETIAEGNNWFVNWADYPMMAVDKDGNKIAHYLAKSSSGTYSYDINVLTKKADSSDWSLPLPPHTDNTPTEHGFVTILPNNDASFTLAWLDGRNTGETTSHDHHGSNGAMTIRTAVVNMEGYLSYEAELDNRVCDCCQTSGVMTEEGPLFVYRDRSVDEIRDMAFVIKSNGSWTEPRLVDEDNWSISGCPVNGPRATSYQGTVAVAWYTAALERPKVKVAFKTGESFEESIVIDDTSPVGRVDIVMIDNQSAVVSWLDGGKNPAIKYRVVNQNGSMSPVFVVAETSEERGSGFPQLELHDGWLYFAWTDMGDVDQIRMKKVALD